MRNLVRLCRAPAAAPRPAFASSPTAVLITHTSHARSSRARLVFTLSALLLVLALAAGTARAQSFSLPIHRDVGFNPYAVAVGDFNGDGKLDVAVANAQGGSVTIALGNGDGTFVSSIEYNTDPLAKGVAVGDFNKDGKLDVAVANLTGGPTSAGNISILFGNGDGTAQPAVNYNAGSPEGLSAADLNSDGNLDLVVPSTSTDKATVLLGNADGTFNAAVGYTVGTHPTGVAVADYNNDGKLDLATANLDGAGLSILLGNGNGTFQAATNLPTSPSLNRPGTITAGDLDGDGKTDLVVASPNDHAVGVLRGNGNGSFQTPVTYPTTGETYNPQLADFNGDGKLDVAAVNATGMASVAVLRGNGDGTLQAAVNVATQSNTWGLVATDFNLDGKPDLITTNQVINRINVLLNSPSARGANFGATATVQVSGVKVAGLIDYDTTKTAADFAATINWGDGTTPGGGTVAANGSGGFDVTGTHTYAAPGVYAVGVQIADADGNFASAAANATVAKRDQTITFAALADKTFGDADFTVSATASSGLAVSFGASGNCSVTDNSVHITGAGSCTITASQGGDANFNAAPNVARSFNIAKLNQLITFNGIQDKIYGGPDFRVFAQTSSALVPTFTTSGNCALVSGNTFHITGAGAGSITASQAGNANYNAAPDVTRSFQIAKADTTTTVTAANATYDGSPHGGTASVTGPAGLNQSVAVSYSGRNGTTYGPSTTAPTNAGDYTASANYAGSSNYNASSDSEDYSISKASQTITFGALSDRTYGDSDFTISASASSGLTVSFGALGSCTVSGSTVHLTGAGSCRITATQLGNSNYHAAAAVPRDFNIARASTSVAVSSSANPSAVGQSVTFTAKVTSPAGPPPGGIFGVVNFYDGILAIPDCASLLSPSGQAACTTSALSAGSHVITAEYATISQSFTGSHGNVQGGQLVGSLMQFSQASYSVAEGGSLTVTVTRSGDTTQAASVGYLTYDGGTLGVVVPCSSVTGLALDRCDYTKARGTLDFAPGETSKTFRVLVGDDSYVEGSEVSYVALSDPSSTCEFGANSSAAFTITDDSPESSGNPSDDDEKFVTQHYLDFLNRRSDAAGLAFWKGQISSCGADAQCRDVKRINVSAAFFLSIEFQETGYLVYRAYKTAYGDATSAGVAGTVPLIRLDQFIPDTQRISRGVVVGQGAWQQQLEANKVAYFEEFVSDSFFANRMPASMSPEQFVSALADNANITLTPSRFRAAAGEFGGSPETGNIAARARALRRVAEDPALDRLERNRAFVLMEYYGYLRRNPDDAPEPTLNFAGWKFWLSKLNSFDGDFVKAEMVKAFLASDEYRHRFGQ
jgi:hypothetical protein